VCRCSSESWCSRKLFQDHGAELGLAMLVVTWSGSLGTMEVGTKATDDRECSSDCARPELTGVRKSILCCRDHSITTSFFRFLCWSVYRPDVVGCMWDIGRLETRSSQGLFMSVIVMQTPDDLPGIYGLDIPRFQFLKMFVAGG